MFLLFAFCCGTSPSCLKVMGGGGGLQHFSVSPSPFWVLDLIGTWLGLGLGVFGTKGLGTGLDNYICIVHSCFALKTI